jgi:hypothetical protein
LKISFRKYQNFQIILVSGPQKESSTKILALIFEEILKNPNFEYTQNKNWLIQPIYCIQYINQPIRGIDLAMTKKLADSCKKLVLFTN